MVGAGEKVVAMAPVREWPSVIQGDVVQLPHTVSHGLLQAEDAKVKCSYAVR